jgi:hypothetical protein
MTYSIKHQNKSLKLNLRKFNILQVSTLMHSDGVLHKRGYYSSNLNRNGLNPCNKRVLEKWKRHLMPY